MKEDGEEFPFCSGCRIAQRMTGVGTGHKRRRDLIHLRAMEKEGRGFKELIRPQTDGSLSFQQVRNFTRGVKKRDCLSRSIHTAAVPGPSKWEGTRTGSRRKGERHTPRQRIHGHTRACHRSIDPIIYRTRNHHHRHHRHHQQGHCASLSEVAICHCHKAGQGNLLFFLFALCQRDGPNNYKHTTNNTAQTGEVDEGGDNGLPSQE